jgi:hypothetical protein
LANTGTGSLENTNTGILIRAIVSENKKLGTMVCNKKTTEMAAIIVTKY